MTDIVEGRAPMQRQGIMAMPQRLVNAIGVYGAGGVAVLATLLLAWLVYTLVLAEAIGWNLEARDAAARAAALKRAEQRRAAKAAPRVAYEERADDADLMALASKVRHTARAKPAPAPAPDAAAPTRAPESDPVSSSRAATEDSGDGEAVDGSGGRAGEGSAALLAPVAEILNESLNERRAEVVSISADTESGEDAPHVSAAAGEEGAREGAEGSEVNLTPASDGSPRPRPAATARRRRD